MSCQAAGGACESSSIDLSVSYGGFRLRAEVAWDCPVLALFGASGSGKTTVLETLAGLRPEVAGRVVLGGRELQNTAARVNLPPSARQVGWVPQDASLFPHLSVRDNLCFGEARGRAAGREGARQALEVLEVGHLLDRKVGALSGGERQRVAVARALASGAKVLLFDEPLASVDVALRGRVLRYFQRLRDELGIPSVYVTHDPHEVLALAGHVAVLERGEVLAQGSPRAVFDTARTLSVLETLGVENSFQVQQRTGEAHPPGLLPVHTAGGTRLLLVRGRRHLPEAFEVAVHAEDILVSIVDPRGVSAHNLLQGSVAGLEYLEDHVYLRVRCDDEVWVAKISSASVQQLELTEGSQVHLVIKAHQIRVLDSAPSSG